MSFSHLSSKLATPWLAATVVGVGCSSFFVIGNTTMALMGTLPYTTSGYKVSTLPEKLDAWNYNYDNGKALFGTAGLVGTVAFITAASLTPLTTLRTPLIVAAVGCGFVAPWTLSVMASTNNHLKSLQASYARVTDSSVYKKHETEVNDLVSHWKTLNMVRIVSVSVAYLAGTGALLLAM